MIYSLANARLAYGSGKTKRGRDGERGGREGPFPRPLPLREGVPAGRDESAWVGECLGGDGLAPSPKGEGWGEVALCFELESKHAYQEYCHRTTSHQRKTRARQRTAS